MFKELFNRNQELFRAREVDLTLVKWAASKMKECEFCQTKCNLKDHLFQMKELKKLSEEEYLQRIGKYRRDKEIEMAKMTRTDFA